MTIQEIQRLRNEQPFRPFRILTADGKTYDVLHPEFMGKLPRGDSSRLGDRLRLEPLDGETTAT